MGRGCALTEEEKLNIKQLDIQKVSKWKIAKIMKRSYHAVANYLGDPSHKTNPL